MNELAVPEEHVKSWNFKRKIKGIGGVVTCFLAIKPGLGGFLTGKPAGCFLLMKYGGAIVAVRLSFLNREKNIFSES